MSAIYPSSVWSRTGSAPIKVLVVDDSVVMRSLIERILTLCPDMQLTGTVRTAAEAFDCLAGQRPDIILLDHEMPGQKGLEALPKLIAMAQGAHVVMLSSHCKRGSRTAVAAMQLGASDTIEKPVGGQFPKAFAETLVAKMRQLAGSTQQRPTEGASLAFRPWPADFRLQCLGIGASTGGIHTLNEVLAALPERLGVPILITQHLPEPFIRYYVQQVARMTDLPVAVAEDGGDLLPDHIYIAPGEASLCCACTPDGAKGVLRPQRDPVAKSRPSVNFMFSAMAECFGAGALGIVLTGIGRDGTGGAADIVRAGGAIIAQDSASSVVWGMPGAVTRAGLASANLRPEQMPGYILDRCGAGR